jgi:hypothetical protein
MAFVGGAVTALLVVYLSLRAGPEMIVADDAVNALVVAASSHLAGFRSGEVVYVKSSYGTDLIEKIRSLYPSLRLLPYSARPLDNGCRASSNFQRLAPCERNDFLIIDALSSPTTLTMLVGFSIYNGGGQLLLFNFGGRWRIVIDRSTVI